MVTSHQGADAKVEVHKVSAVPEDPANPASQSQNDDAASEVERCVQSKHSCAPTYDLYVLGGHGRHSLTLILVAAPDVKGL